MDLQISDISHVIQLAVAPVFLLAGIGAFINAFAGRLSRIVDRSRKVETMVDTGTVSTRVAAVSELKTLARRARTIYVGITLAIGSALLVCLLIVMAFVGHFLSIDLSWAIGSLFTIAMLTLIGGLLAFLREVFLAVRSLTIGRDE